VSEFYRQFASAAAAAGGLQEPYTVVVAWTPSSTPTSASSSTVITRQEHLALSISRAMGYALMNDYKTAVASFLSDMDKHSETRNIVEGSALFTAKIILESANQSPAVFKRAMEGF
jgi:hypothetical protein